MDIERVFPHVVFHLFGVPVRDTVLVTWGIMLVVTTVSWLGTRKLLDCPGTIQNGLEAALELVEGVIGELTSFSPKPFLPLIGTLAIFLVACNSVSMIPGLGAPTRDMNTTAALAVVVFFSVHFYGLRIVGPKRYLRGYIEPFWLLLPFNLVGELSRTVALAIRLFGNILSGEIIAAILLGLAGLLVPVPMQVFGLLIGLIQAYVFSLLSMVFIVAGLRGNEPTESVEGVSV
jgi:F-type H+-transporting ATPase subunit a